ncbi:hypothetical protein [Brachyspira hyodysenteriae]|nr:hypothetical protein [Brachyspira hyodysenteriae]MCZ9977015.1 hypothetical protein [Brachyspira hyodysenteriae]
MTIGGARRNQNYNYFIASIDSMARGIIKYLRHIINEAINDIMS